MKYRVSVFNEEGEHVLCGAEFGEYRGDYSFGGVSVSLSSKKIGDGLVLFTLTASGKGKCYLSLCGEGEAEFCSFNDFCREEHVFRQSPHDPKMYNFRIDGSAVPMVAAVSDTTDIFVSDHPGTCDNYTTQHVLPGEKKFYLSSGDPGGIPNLPEGREGCVIPPHDPYYHDLSVKPHVFSFLWVKSRAKDIKAIRKDVFVAIERAWGTGSDSVYRAVCFGANYMHLRKNETKTSDIWIVAGLQYSTHQYDRDSFWQTFIVSKEAERQCYLAHSADAVREAENPLFYIIWSYRVYKNGGEIDGDMFRVAFDRMMQGLRFVGDGRYCPEGRPDGSFRNWFDICCYEKDDADAYSQGLCVTALRAAEELGYDTCGFYPRAIEYYKTLFNGEFVQMSAKKPYLAVDFTIGDLLHCVLFGTTFIPDGMVLKTYRRIMDGKANTPYGVKVVAAPDGDFLPMEAFGAYGYVHPWMAQLDVGRYANGGSYHIYEMLFHIAAHLHGAKDAVDNMIRRLFIDLDYDGATHEYMHTVRGFGSKANQGWNAAVYAIWDTLCRRGDGDRRFFDAAEKKFREI